MRTVQRGPLFGLMGQFVLLAWLTEHFGLGPVGCSAGLAYGVVIRLLLVRGLDRTGATTLGAANAVTLTRATLVGGVTALVVDGFVRAVPVVVVVALAVVALLLDGVDGQVARRTGTVSALGARFDMEVDAYLILVLSVAVGRSIGWWVLLMGVAYYAHVAAGWILPWLRATLPPRYWRKPAAAIQGIVLTLALSGLLPQPMIIALLLLAMILLAESFGRDELWLWRRTRQPEAQLGWLSAHT